MVVQWANTKSTSCNNGNWSLYHSISFYIYINPMMFHMRTDCSSIITLTGRQLWPGFPCCSWLRQPFGCCREEMTGEKAFQSGLSLKIWWGGRNSTMMHVAVLQLATLDRLFWCLFVTFQDVSNLSSIPQRSTKQSNMTDFLRVFCLVRKTSVQVDRCVVSLQIVHVLDVPTAGHPWLRFHPSVAFSAWNVRCCRQRAALTVDQNIVSSASPFQTCCIGINIFCWLMKVVYTKQWSDLRDLLRCIPSIQMTFH